MTLVDIIQDAEDACTETKLPRAEVSTVALAGGLYAIARAIDRLGNADAATPMGGMEALGKVLADSIDGLAAVLAER